MADNSVLQHAIFILIITLTSLSFTTTAQQPPQFLSPLTSITKILTTLGYTDLAAASHALSLSSDLHHLPWYNPITVFAATDTSLRTCHSCSLPLLLKQHSLPALYPFHYLQHLLFGTKIETLHLGHCLTVTSAAETSTVFINGVEITHPNIYVSDTVIVHGIQGFISQLSPYSCLVTPMTSLSLPHHAQSPSYALTPLMITDAMIRLRTSGLSVLALALRVKFAELSNLNNMTVFSINDEAIFHDGNSYIHNVKYHIIPNRVLKLVDLENLPLGTMLPTLENGEFLTVTTAGGGGVLSPVRINFVKITKPDFIYNTKLVVHGIANAFPRMRKSISGEYLGSSDESRSSSGNIRPSIDYDTPPHVMESTLVSDYYHHGL